VTFKTHYATPDGFSDMTMFSYGESLIGLCFDDSPDCSKHDFEAKEERDLAVFRKTKEWLDGYFAGEQPEWTPRLSFARATPFRREVAQLMLSIPFGQSTTYGELASRMAKRHGIAKMSARAVGSAVGWNPICIIVPCHRVLGSTGNITGYGGGIENKIALLRHEGLDVASLPLPKNSRHWLNAGHSKRQVI